MNHLAGWYPIAALDDVAPRHVFAAELGGHELAVWRADDGFVNVWEDRCLHRGVRLSIGLNDGAELQCQYHGWRYANRTAGCTYIPAHPGDAPARSLCARTYPALVRHGLVWSTLGTDADFPQLAVLEAQRIVVARAVPFDVPLGTVAAHLPALTAALADGGSRSAVHGGVASEREARALAVGPNGSDPSPAAPDPTGDVPGIDNEAPPGDGSIEAIDGTLGVVVGSAGAARLVCFLQPCDNERTIARPLLIGDAASTSQLRRLSSAMEALRRSVEADVAGSATHELLDRQRGSIRVVRDQSVIDDPAVGHPGSTGAARDHPTTGRDEVDAGFQSIGRLDRAQRLLARLKVEVVAKRVDAQGVVAFELGAVDEPLPTPLPGDHIDVVLPNALVRQYSLTNAPGHTGTYRIAVLRTEPSRGGSMWLHDHVRVGELLEISPPRHGFVLRRDAPHTVLIAGGIGVTPLMSMAAALRNDSLSFELHYFVRSPDHIAFADALEGFGPAVHRHVGLDARGTQAEVGRVLSVRPPRAQLYVCGPAPMLEATRRIAAEAGWPDQAVHAEYFANPNTIRSDRAFEIVLARSGMTLQVPAGASALEVLRANGTEIDSSCEQGACGTCVVRLIEGQPDHQDVYLSAGERAAGDRMTTCVSRALGDRLVLDL